MSLPAQNAIFSIAPQAAKIGRDGTFVNGSHTWYRYRVPRIGVAPMQDQQVWPPETGGPVVPTGSYKQAKLWGGDIDIMPRSEGDFGWLLYALMGDVTSVPTVSGVTYYTHHFKFAADSFTTKWIAARRFIPGVTSPDQLGEIMFDGKANNMRLMIPAMGPVAGQIGFVGRDWELEEEPSWTYADVTEVPTSAPMAGEGFLKIGGTEYPITGVEFMLNNGFTTPQQEMIVGDYAPDDFVILNRGASFRFIYKYENPDLWQQIYTGAVDGTTFDPLPHIISSNGELALEAQFHSPAPMPGVTSERKYELHINADRVVLASGRPTELAAGGLILCEFIGTILEPAAGKEYLTIKLVNLQSAYTWPT